LKDVRVSGLKLAPQKQVKLSAPILNWLHEAAVPHQAGSDTGQCDNLMETKQPTLPPPANQAWTADTVEQPSRRLWQVENGVLHPPKRILIYLLFKRLSIWLLALEENMLSHVWIMGYATDQDFVAGMQQLGADKALITSMLGESVLLWTCSQSKTPCYLSVALWSL
jgi:hypothetical protein